MCIHGSERSRSGGRWIWKWNSSASSHTTAETRAPFLPPNQVEIRRPPAQSEMAQRQLQQQQLRDVGSRLDNPPASKDALLKLLKQAANFLSELDQSPLPSMLDAMKPCLNAIVKPELLKHQDKDVRLLVATCICEVTRITAPEAPYSDDILKGIFHLIVGTFNGLGDINSASFGRRVVILETFARYRLCVMMLDIECFSLINEMYKTFFTVTSDNHPANVISSMQAIMALILEESEDVLDTLLINLLSPLGRKRNGFSFAAQKLAKNVLVQCAKKLEAPVKQFLISSLSGDSNNLSNFVDYHEVIYDLYQCAPQILYGIVPYITDELLTDKQDVRLKTVHLLGELFALPGLQISEHFQYLLSEFLKRLTDRAVEVRLSVIEHAKNCLLSSPLRPEAPQIIGGLCDRLLDYDENVRKQAVAALCDVACHSVKCIPSETARLVAERLRDKSLAVKKYTMERLADLHRHLFKCIDSSVILDDYKWISGKMLRCLYDKDFRSEYIELALCGSLFPPEVSIKERVKIWINVFSDFDRAEVKALEQILMQKQRLQQEMQKYLSLRQTSQEFDAPELQKNFSLCFRMMSRLFNDPTKAEENFQILNQLKDTNIWKILMVLLDPHTTFHQAWSLRDELLKILGERHPLYDFMGMLTVKCSYLLFGKEHAKEALTISSTQPFISEAKLTLACMSLLTIIASFFPQLLVGCEEDLIHLLKGDNDIVKEGITHVLAKAGGTIREKLTMSSSSIELLLERLCSEGSRKQAKYSILALAAIAKDEGLKSLSVLYKRLVDMLECKTHLPAILQSLGCIAQTAMPVFETREDYVVRFIRQKILESSNKANASFSRVTNWNTKSELCQLKVYGIKTMVKSYLPIKDAHLRPGFERLVEILKNILVFGNVSKDIKSSVVDMAHMRLAAAKAVLRLSRQWDVNIPVDLFHMILRFSEDNYPESRKVLLNKIHQYIKERLLDAKYACAFLLNYGKNCSPDFREAKQVLSEVILICHQVKARHLALQSSVTTFAAYPENILVYLVHELCHHPSCPNLDVCKDFKAFEAIYRCLHLLISLLLHGDESSESNERIDRKKESFIAVNSVLHSIKCSKDVIDETKTNASHAICDLGLCITKRMVNDPTVKSSVYKYVSLPVTLYKTSGENETEAPKDNDKHNWLCDTTAMTHFEDMNVDKKEQIGSDISVLVDGEDKEIPLKELIKILKTKVPKKVKQSARNMASNVDIKSSKNNADILKVSQEKKLVNSESAEIVETRNMTGDIGGFRSGWTAMKKKNVKAFSSHKVKKVDDSVALIATTPKRKRSTVVHRSSSGKSKSLHSAGMEKPSNKFPVVNVVDSTNSDILLSCSPESTPFTGVYGRLSQKSHVTEMNSAFGTETDIGLGKVKSLANFRRKHKRRSIAGIQKCASQAMEKNKEELNGSRIKVWWPLDKQFYEGVVQFYDPGKKKHVVLYNDGDVEVLNLDKEKWELISKENISTKKGASKSSTRSELSLRKARIHDDSKNKKNSSKKYEANQRKSTPYKRRGGKRKFDTCFSHVKGSTLSHSNEVHTSPGHDNDCIDSDPRGEDARDAWKPGQQNGVKSNEVEESMHERTILSSSDKRNSDDEPLSKWRKRSGNC